MWGGTCNIDRCFPSFTGQPLYLLIAIPSRTNERNANSNSRDQWEGDTHGNGPARNMLRVPLIVQVILTFIRPLNGVQLSIEVHT